MEKNVPAKKHIATIHKNAMWFSRQEVKDSIKIPAHGFSGKYRENIKIHIRTGLKKLRLER